MSSKRDLQIDKYLRRNLKKFHTRIQPIEPTLDFQDRVMVKISKLEQENKRNENLIGVGIGLAPFILRQAWFLIRGDYFSVARLPWGDGIVKIYNFLIAPTTAYAFLSLGVAVFTYISFRRGWSISSRWI